MNRTVFLLGTDHKYQHNSKYYEAVSKDAILKFKSYLVSVCEYNSIKTIGEEFHISHLKKDRKMSVPREVALSLNICHKYCDPDRDEQIKFGIKESGFFTQNKKLPEFLQPEEIQKLTQEEADELEWKEDLKREPIWLSKILELNVWPLLFICGPKHIESFSKLLIAESFKVNIVNKNWEPQSK